MSIQRTPFTGIFLLSLGEGLDRWSYFGLLTILVLYTRDLMAFIALTACILPGLFHKYTQFEAAETLR